jgi:hypothetical protein
LSVSQLVTPVHYVYDTINTDHSKRVKLCEHQSIIGGADHMFICLYIKVVLGVVAACARATHVGTALLA